MPWLGWTCGECRFCASGRENLCDRARFTGRDIDGGFAEWTVADERFCFPVPDGYPAVQAAPLLCAGLIGHRALRMAGDAERLGLYGFGAAAHIVCQVAVWEGRRVFAFTRAGDVDAQALAAGLGAEWAGDASGPAPEPLDAALLFAPVGEHVPAALAAVEPGGTVVCAGIHMSDIPSFPYELLWGERTLRSVANLTRADGEEFLALAPQVPVRTHVTAYPLERANEALADLREGRLTGRGGAGALGGGGRGAALGAVVAPGGAVVVDRVLDLDVPRLLEAPHREGDQQQLERDHQGRQQAEHALVQRRVREALPCRDRTTGARRRRRRSA